MDVSVFSCECGDHCFRKLNRGYVTIFDPEDAHLASKGSFWVRVINKRTVYAIHQRYVGIGQPKNFRFHREIMNASPDIQIDHISGNGLDNRKRNLRNATHSQNQCNKPPLDGCSSKYMGVSWSKCSNRWRATIQSNKKLTHIGRFDSEIDAAIGYDQCAVRLHGEFARLNFPNKPAVGDP